MTAQDDKKAAEQYVEHAIRAFEDLAQEFSERYPHFKWQQISCSMYDAAGRNQLAGISMEKNPSYSDKCLKAYSRHLPKNNHFKPDQDFIDSVKDLLIP